MNWIKNMILHCYFTFYKMFVKCDCIDTPIISITSYDESLYRFASICMLTDVTLQNKL